MRYIQLKILHRILDNRQLPSEAIQYTYTADSLNAKSDSARMMSACVFQKLR